MNVLNFGGRTDLRPAFWFILFFPCFASAKWNQTYEFQTWAVHDVLETDVLGESFADDDLVARMEARYRYKSGNFLFTADPQLRFIGTYLETNTNYSIKVHNETIRAPDRGVRLETPLWGSPSSSEFQASFERLTVGFKNQSAELSIGRQPFSLGVMKIVPIWNRFTVNLPVPGVYVQFPNHDGASFHYQRGVWDFGAYAILENETERNAYLTENVFNFPSLELRFLGGEWQENLVGGVAASVPLFGGSFRGEFLGIGGRTEDRIQMNEWGLGYETALTATLKFTIENLFLSTGAINQQSYNTTRLNFFQPLLAEDYLTVKIRYESESFYAIEPQVIMNLVDGSMIVGGEASYSLGDHSEVGLQGNIPTGARGQEFSANASPLGSFGPSGVAEQVLLRYRLTY